MKGNGAGFAHLRNVYKDFENAFKVGTYRTVDTIKKGTESTVEWIP